jgi:hypothetical protein
MPYAEMLYLNNEDEALPILLYVQKQNDDISHSLNVMTEQFIKRGLIINNDQSPDGGDECDDMCEDDDEVFDEDEDESQGMTLQ